MPTPISIRGITKEFPAIGAGTAGGTTRAVDNISLEIETGELFFLLGPSGCGKTTLLRMIAGFIDPTSGTILFGSRDVTHLPPNQRNTGMVFQSYALWPHMTIEANVAFGLDVRKTPANEAKTRIDEALAAVRMSQYSKRKPNQLSGGQQQRIALARALVIRPDVLLLDEPLSNLDAKLRLELRSEIRRICKESGITTVYVTHDQKEALSMADRVAILRSGRVEQLGTPADLYKRPHSRFVAEFLGETNILEGTVISISETPSPMGARAGGGQVFTATLETPAGKLEGSIPPGLTPPKPNSRALLSIRPESIHISESELKLPPQFQGKLTSATYLGEVEQGHIQVGAANLKFLKLSNLAQPLHAGDSQVPVSISDAIVLPLSDSNSGT
ncbi:MAG: ABC transporter ATP-binding protein [Phycisphaeraceae bacterium]|nr:ABC transporter ATP-binding protein [Phycisphaeraceae bacterium]